jgi:hypothetical protein
MLEIFQKGFYWSSDAAREIEDGYRTTSKDLGNGLASGLRHVCIVFSRPSSERSGRRHGRGWSGQRSGPRQIFHSSMVLGMSLCHLEFGGSIVKDIKRFGNISDGAVAAPGDA